MKLIIYIFLNIVLLTACKINKHSSKSASNTTKTNASKSDNGIYAPDTLALNAIKIKYPDITLTQLNEGYIIYTYGPCINCHQAKNIYQFNENKWVHIIEEMAVLAEISGTQKDAVLKYVLSIKATQTK
jgi:hypothetical protein